MAAGRSARLPTRAALLGALTAVLLAGDLLAWSPARAAAGGVTATAAPEQVALPPGGSAAGLLTLVNGGTVAVPVTIRLVPPDRSVQVTLRRTAVRLAAGQSTSVDFTLTRVAE